MPGSSRSLPVLRPGEAQGRETEAERRTLTKVMECGQQAGAGDRSGVGFLVLWLTSAAALVPQNRTTVLDPS